MFGVAKEVRINVRTTQETKDELEIVSKLRGINVSSIVNAAMREIIRQEKEREPQAFVLTPLPAKLKLPKGTLESIDHHKIPKEIPPNAKRKNSKA